MKRTIISAAVLSISLIGGGVSFAGHEDDEPGPGPNGHNTFGLCTAYFAGSDEGRSHKRNAGPFQALEDEAGVDEGDTPEQRDEAVREYCDASGQHPGGGNGNNGG